MTPASCWSLAQARVSTATTCSSQLLCCFMHLGATSSVGIQVSVLTGACYLLFAMRAGLLLLVLLAADLRHLVPQVAPAAYDMAIGGLAGAVAVLVSMPFDVVKTYIQTNHTAATAASGQGLLGSAAAFWQTGQQLVARGGPGQLFVGLLPRLAHQVPGAMVCWLVIESCQRFLLQAAARAEQAADSAAPAVKVQQVH